jgi:hypothetical protein
MGRNGSFRAHFVEGELSRMIAMISAEHCIHPTCKSRRR